KGCLIANFATVPRELTIQSHALLVVRTLDLIFSALQCNRWGGIELDALAAVMYLFAPCFTMPTVSTSRA
ncbi:hypothetical protein ACSQHR_004785, partial [Salmonella enterica subsp. enterica]